MTWLFPSVVATCTGSCVLFLFYLYLARVYKERHLQLWACAWGVYTLRFLALLLGLRWGQTAFLNIAVQEASLISGLLLLAGTLEFLSKRFPPALLAAGIVGIVWCVAGELLAFPFLLYTLPTFTFLALVYVGCGVALLRRRDLVGIGSNVAGWSFILWGLHKGNYPWLREAAWFAPWGYLIAAILSLTCALGIVLMYFEEMQRKLKVSEKRYRTLFQTMAEGAFYKAEDDTIVDCNRAVLDMLGLTKDQFVGRTSMDPAWHVVTEAGEELPGDQYPSTLALRTGKPVLDQVLGVFNPHRKDYVWLSISAIPQFQQDASKPYQVFVTLHDITERKTAQERHGLILKTALDGFWLLDSDGRFLEVNDAYCAMSGYSQDELRRMSVADIEAKECREEVAAHLAKIREQGQDRFETQHRRKDGSVFDVEISTAMLTGLHEVRYVFVRDISERKHAEAELLRQQRTISLNNRIANVFLTVDTHDIYSGVLDALREFLDSQFGYFGYIDDAGNLVFPSMTKDVWDQCQVVDKTAVFPREVWGGLWGQSLVEKRPLMAEGELTVPEGHMSLQNALAVPIIHHDALIGQFVVANKPGGYDAHDMDLLVNAAAQTAPVLHSVLEEERQKREQAILEEHLRQAQKMEAIGTLAGGIAHDFNNIIAAIIGYAELLEEDLADASPECLSHVSQILHGSERAAELVGQILAFSRRADSDRKPFQLGPLVKETTKMLRGAIPSTVGIDVVVSDGPDTVVGDVTQINQVLMNLCTNAWHAMGEEGGVLRVFVSPFEIPSHDDIPVTDVAPGSYVKLLVEDTGKGIPEEDLPRIFEPFFTTKPKGKGTGMGLSVVHGVVTAHGGAVTVRSTEGRGTTFEILLPRSEQAESSAEPERMVELPGGNERVLLVDDEEAILDLASHALSSLGYTVTAQPDGHAALAAFRENAEPYDLVITDLSMPGMTGLQLASEILRTTTGARIILCTGYGDSVSVSRAREIGVRRVLRKPVPKRRLAECVRAVLDGREYSEKGT